MRSQEFGLYFLIFPDAPAAARIAALARRCRSEHGLRAKLLPMSRFHVSLQNLGRYDELARPKVTAAKARDAAARVRASPFVIMFSRVESVSGGNGRHPLVLREDDGVAGLEMLNRSLGATMRMTGLGRVWISPLI